VTTPQKNAIVLTVVAVVVAGMVYTGAKHSRRIKPLDEQGLQSDLRGKPAPDFELNTIDDKKIKLSDLRGKAIVVNFWATWCDPCKLEMPWLVDLQEKYSAQGLVILGLNVDQGSKEKVASFAKEMGVNYPVLRATDAVSDLYGGIDGLPTTFYVGRDGVVVEQGAGIISKDLIEDNIKAALARSGAPASANSESGAKQDKTKQ
jgi:thiol-disulfide isomerase/thioredoxin